MGQNDAQESAEAAVVIEDVEASVVEAVDAALVERSEIYRYAPSSCRNSNPPTNIRKITQPRGILP